MRSFTIVSLFFLLSFLCACTQQDSLNTANAPVDVQLSAAFTSLVRVDVHDMSGDYMETIDSSVDFQDVLPAGTYYMDFVNEDGDHSFMDDGRLAFAPMGEGMTPLDGPFDIDDQPMWQVAVDQVLEGNARLNIRIRDGDETLRPWKDLFPGWQANLPEEDRDPIEDSEWIADGKAYSTTTNSSSARLRVTWELSFAMSGDYSNSGGNTCTGDVSGSDATSVNYNCWTRSTSAPSGSYYAYYGGSSVRPADSKRTGYIDYDTAMWSSARSAYGSYFTCLDWNNASSGTANDVTCYNSVSSSDASQYTCQSSTASPSTTTNAAACSSTTTPRGAQCKAFTNLTLVRSGQYNSGAWRTMSNDATTYSSTTSYPFATTSSIAIGDVLRFILATKSGTSYRSGTCSGNSSGWTTSGCSSGSAHSMTVVAYDSSSKAVLVVDSNYSGGDGREYIAAHVMSYSSSTTSTSRSYWTNYRDLDCIYAGTC